MPIYVFQNEQGGTEEHFLPVASAPCIGDAIRIEGRTLKRLPSPMQVSAGVEQVTHGYPYVSTALPRSRRMMPPGTKFAGGKPIVRSRRHEREIASMQNLVRD